ncbi:MAG: hypothetical protein AB7K86_12340 [Rhodospirillales bacterium]
MLKPARWLAAALIAGATVPARAADEAPKQEPGGELQRELERGAARIMDAVRDMLRAIPQYEAPIVNDNGDIIIRRKREPAPAEPPPAPAPPRADEPSRT